ncbi:unnamed protein product [Colias eurytheme]|nr:unnamed protein product [Colias eurytheme]
MIVELESQVGGKRREMEEYVVNSISDLLAQGCQIDENLTPSPESPASETSTECLMHLLQQCEPKTARNITDTVNRHRKELETLEQELQARVSSVAAQRVKVERLQAELALLAARQRGLTQALADPDGEGDYLPIEGVKRSKSELVLRIKDEDPPEPLSADEREHYRAKRLSLSLSLDPLPSPSLTSPTPPSPTFHTASSSPKLPSESTLPSPSTTEGSMLPSEELPRFKLNASVDDSDDMSSTEEYHKPSRIVEGQSSSSIERSPEERHQRSKYRRRLAGDRRGRQVTEAEALRAMQRLCSRIASQKMLVISSLENDCSKEDLNRQIQVLQELQKKYVRLEMALQYSFFDNQQSRRTIMVTPIQETPSLTLSESDMHVSTETAGDGLAQDSLRHRLKDSDGVEASDNVSTSNDELGSEPSWPDPLRALASPDASDLDHDHDQDLDNDRDHDREDYRRRDRPTPLVIPDYTLEGLHHPIDFSEVISVPGWVTRGAGAGTHHEYEVRVRLGPHCAWQLLRRYRRFRDLYLAARKAYGAQVAAIPFPPRALWSSESLARSRRPQLESFLRRLLATCALDRRCPLHREPLTRDRLQAFSPFFRKVS